MSSPSKRYVVCFVVVSTNSIGVVSLMWVSSILEFSLVQSGFEANAYLEGQRLVKKALSGHLGVKLGGAEGVLDVDNKLSRENRTADHSDKGSRNIHVQAVAMFSELWKEKC